jgi:hypothetical protein
MTPVSADPVAVLKDALQRAGISTEGTFQVVEQTVFFPAGSYVDKQIVADFGGGKKENFNVDLVMKNPAVAAADVKRLLAA